MDDRQRQIQVGAGLQESRLNTDLIQWLEKYGTWVLSAVLVVVVVYVGWTRYSAWKLDKLDVGFEQYQAARVGVGADGVLLGSPDNLLTVARENEGRGSISHLARLDAAEIYLGCVRRGLRPGSNINESKPEDAISADETSQMIETARSLFEEVRSATAGRSQLAPLHLRSMWGLVAVAMSRNETDKAKTLLEEIEQVARRAKLDEQADKAKARIEAVSTISAPTALLSDADLAPIPGSSAEELEQSINAAGPEVEQLPPGVAPPGWTAPIDPPTGAAPAPAPVEEKPADPGNP